MFLPNQIIKASVGVHGEDLTDAFIICSEVSKLTNFRQYHFINKFLGFLWDLEFSSQNHSMLRHAGH